MDNQMLEQKILRNLTDIKDRISVSFDSIVDFLIEKDVIKMRVKIEIDAIRSPAEKSDYLIQLVTTCGNSGCKLFIEALRKNGLSDLANKIKRTHACIQEKSADNPQKKGQLKDRDVPPTVESRADQTSDSDGDLQETNDSKNDIPSLNLNEATVLSLVDRVAKLETQRGRDLQTAVDLFKKEMQAQRMDQAKEREENRRQNEELQKYNRELDEKFNALEKDFKLFRNQSAQEIAEKNKEIERLRKRNSVLKRDLENTARNLRNRDAQCDGLTREVLELKFRLREQANEMNELGSELVKLQEEDKGRPKRGQRNQTDTESGLPDIHTGRSLVAKPSDRNKRNGNKHY